MVKAKGEYRYDTSEFRAKGARLCIMIPPEIPLEIPHQFSQELALRDFPPG